MIFPHQHLSQEFGFGDTELAVVAELKGYEIGWGREGHMSYLQTNAVMMSYLSTLQH